MIWIITAELLPPKIRSVGQGLIICSCFLGGFIVAKTFVDLIQSIQVSGTFFLYGALCFIGFAFTFFFVPETKGKSVQEIETAFQQSFGQMIKNSFKCS